VSEELDVLKLVASRLDGAGIAELTVTALLEEIRA
jgi:hypothetical protein